MSKKPPPGVSEKRPDRKTRVVLPLETLVDAWAMAQVEGAAKAAAFYGIHPSTIARAGGKIARSEELRATAELKRQELATEWRPKAMRALSAGLDALEKLFKEAKRDQIRDVAGAVHLLAEKLIAVDVIPNVRRQAQAPARPAATTNVRRDLSTTGQGAPAASAGSISGAMGSGRTAAGSPGTGGGTVPTGNA